MTTQTTPSSNQAPPIDPKRSSGVSPALIITIFIGLLGALTYGIYTIGSSLSGEEQTASIDNVVEEQKTSNSTESSNTPQGSYTRAEAYGKLFQTLYATGSALAGMPKGSDLLGMPDQSSFAQELDLPTQDPNLALEREKAVLDELGQPSADQALVAEQPNSDAPQQTLSTIYLGSSGLSIGDTVITEIMAKQPEGYFSPDKAALTQAAQEEFAKAKLTRAELDILANFDLNGGNFDQSNFEVVKKLIRLFYYGQVLQKQAALSVMLGKLHPSLQDAIRNSPDLGAGLSAPAEPQVPQAAALEQAENLALKEAQAVLEQVVPQAQIAKTTLNSVESERSYEQGRQAANSGKFSKAYEIWLSLAEQGHSKSQTALGRMYARGDGVERNYTEAMRWFQMAANQGDDKALLSLGKMYLYGHGVQKDKTQAARYFSQALAHGNSEAQSLLSEAQG